MRKLWLLVPVVFLLWWHKFVDFPPGVLVGEEPYQRLANVAPWEYKGGRIVALSEYRIRARLLGREYYWFDWGAKFAPLDLAVGWGPMSDQSVLDRLSWYQSVRFYYWRPRKRDLPMPADVIISYSANMHVIPADSSVLNSMTLARAGQIIRMAGYLVEITTPEGGRWRSSLSRTDTGAGACELMWVTQFSRE